jgi:hypothetical protein
MWHHIYGRNLPKFWNNRLLPFWSCSIPKDVGSRFFFFKTLVDFLSTAWYHIQEYSILLSLVWELKITWNMHDYKFYFICLIIDHWINTVQILWYFRNNSTSVVNSILFSLNKKYVLYLPTSHKILLYCSISFTGDVTTYFNYPLKKATRVAETSRRSLCNKITFVNRSTFVGLFSKFTLSFPLILHFSNINIALNIFCATWYKNCVIAKRWDISKEHLEFV